MGRPIKKLYIGNTSGTGQQLAINAWLPGDTQARTGFIVSQKGTGRYSVQTADGTGNVFVNTVSIQSGAPAAAGQASILVTPYGASGSGATANAVVGASHVTVAAGGSNYTVGDTLTFSTGWSTNAVLTIAGTTGAGAVSAVTITNSGARSLTLPAPGVSCNTSTTSNISAASATFTFDKWVVKSVAVGVAGSGYDAAPTVSFSTAGSTIPATATATLSGTTVGSIAVGYGGLNYTSIPAVSFTNLSVTDYARKINDDTVVTWGGNSYTWYPTGTALTTPNSAVLPTA